MIRENQVGRVSHFLTFMFQSIPGNRDTKKEVMKRDVIRAHDLLMRNVVRKPDSANWKSSRPIFIGCPDLPVIKRTKQPIRNLIVNDGLHFHAIALTPALYGPKTPLMHYYRPSSRLKVPLVDHFIEKQSMYQTEHLYRVDVMPITYGTMTDYTLKAFKNGRVGSDDILVLN